MQRSTTKKPATSPARAGPVWRGGAASVGEGGEGALADFVDAAGAADLAAARRLRIAGGGPLRVVRDERLGLLVVGGQPLAHDVLGVVGALGQRLAGDVVLAVDLGRVVVH